MLLIYWFFLAADINECYELGRCANGQCVNVQGSYYCQCNPGFDLTEDRMSCQGRGAHRLTFILYWNCCQVPYIPNGKSSSNSHFSKGCQTIVVAESPFSAVCIVQPNLFICSWVCLWTCHCPGCVVNLCVIPGYIAWIASDSLAPLRIKILTKLGDRQNRAR